MGTIGGIQNTVSNIAGIVAPVVTGILVSRTGGFEAALTLAAVVAILGAASYWLLMGPVGPIRLQEESGAW